MRGASADAVTRYFCMIIRVQKRIKECTSETCRNILVRDTLVLEEKNLKISKRVFRDQGSS